VNEIENGIGVFSYLFSPHNEEVPKTNTPVTLIYYYAVSALVIFNYKTTGNLAYL